MTRIAEAARPTPMRGRWGWRAARALAAIVVMWLSAGAALAAQVNAWDHGPFGRLVIDWGTPVPVAVTQQDGRVIITTDRSINSPVGVISDRLSAYIDRVALEEGGRRLVLVPTGPLNLAEIPFDNGLVLDMRREGQVGRVTEPSPQAIAPASSDLERIRVRGGEHGSFSRVVFDWTSPVSYRTERDGTLLRVIFDRPAIADLSLAYPESLSRVGAIRQLPGREGMVVGITIAEDSRVRFFESGLKVVIDILGGAPGTAPETVPEPDTVAAVEAQATEPAAEPEEAPATPTDSSDAGEPAPRDDRQTAASPEPERPVAAPEDGAAPGEEPAAPPPVETAEAQPERAPAEPDAVPDEAPDGTAAPADVEAPARPQEETTTAPVPAPAPEAAEGPPDASTAALPSDEPETVPAEEPPATPFAATFDPGRPTSLAAFARGGALWVAMAADRPLDVNALKAQGERAFGPGRIVAADNGAVIVWPLDGALSSGEQPVVDRRGDTWLVALPSAAEDAAEPRPVRIERQPDFPLGARLFVDEASADRVIGVADPRVGDRLLIVPLADPGASVAGLRRQVGFDLLPTGQGVVIRPASDDLAVRPVTGGVEITRPDGLPLSPVGKADLPTPASLNVGRVFDIPRWRGPEGRFVETRRELRRNVVRVPDSEIDQARLDLARFYFSHGLGAEAEGLIDLVARSTPGVTDRPEFKALRGATAVLTGDADRAVADLSDPELDGDAEIALWRGGAAVLAEDWPAASAHFREAGELISVYPAPFRDRFFVSAMQAALHGGDAATAAAGLDWLSDRTDGESDRRPRIAYLRGLIAEARQRPDEAQRWYRRAAESDDRLWRTRGELALIQHGLATGDLAPGDATDRLEALRFAWRGDALETNILRTLGDAAWAAGRHAAAFGHYEHAASIEPDKPHSRTVAELLPMRYRELLGGPALDETSPLAAYAIFEDRRDLLPEGDAGDRIIERVAESLASVDLLDRAAGLLEELAEERLETPAEKARIGARAAGLRLLDDRPEAALATLDATEPDFAPVLPAGMTMAGLAIDRAAAGGFEAAGTGTEDGTTMAEPTTADDAPAAAKAAQEAPAAAEELEDRLASELDSAMTDVLGAEAAAALAESIEAVSDGANTGAVDTPEAETQASGTGETGEPDIEAAPAGDVQTADLTTPVTAPVAAGSEMAATASAEGDVGDLLAERRLLRARALADLGRPERALSLIADDRSAVAEAAKLDIAWSNRLWDQAAEVLARRVGPPPALGEPIDDQTARRVVDLAVAEALADDRAALDRLAIGFGPAMEATDYANTFAVVTRSGGASAPIDDLAAVRRQVEEIETFQSFLDGYRQRTTPALIN